MTPRFVFVLLLAAIISSLGAFVAYRANNVFVPQAGVGEKVLAGFDKQINDVAKIEIKQGLKSMSLVRTNAQWKVEKTGYPVSAAKVKQALITLSELKKLEAKTANEKKYLLISVDAAGKKDGRGRTFTLYDKQNKKLASIVAGKTVVGKQGPGRDAQYVRVSDQKTSWLASGAVLADTLITSWLDPRFLALDVDSITSGVITHKDGEIVSVRRTGADGNGSSTFELLNIPVGRKPLGSTSVKFAATDFANLDMVDVRKAGKSNEFVSVAIIQDKQGLKLQLSLLMEGKIGWVRVEVLEKGKNAKLAKEIIKRTKGWEYRISKSDRSAFERRNENLLQKQK